MGLDARSRSPARSRPTTPLTLTLRSGRRDAATVALQPGENDVHGRRREARARRPLRALARARAAPRRRRPTSTRCRLGLRARRRDGGRRRQLRRRAALRPRGPAHDRAHRQARAGHASRRRARATSCSPSAPSTIGSDRFTVDERRRRATPRGGLRVTMTLDRRARPDGRSASSRSSPASPASRRRRSSSPPPALALSSVVLEQAAAARGDGRRCTPSAPAPTGASPDWTGPQLQVGDPHAGTWRDTQARRRPSRASASGSRSATAAHVFLVSEGTDFPSARGAYDGTTAQLRSDYGQDVILLGPLEESGAHREPGRPARAAPAPRPARARRSRSTASSPASAATTTTRRGSSPSTCAAACSPSPARSSSTPTTPTPTASRPARRTTWTSRRSARPRRSPRRWASRRSCSTTAGRRARATGSPTRPSSPSRAAPRRASPTPSSRRSARRSRR